MKTFFEGSPFMLIFLLLGVQVPIYLLLPYGVEGLVLIGFLLILLSYTLVRGAASGLFWSLPYLFLLGAALFDSQFSNRFVKEIVIPLPLMMAYGVVLISLILLAGYIQEQMANQKQLVSVLQERIRRFTAVDLETGFDNPDRMEFEVASEMKRINRYGGSFVLLILQIDHYVEFQKLYGEKEREHLLSSLAGKLSELTRQTDRKFRYDGDSLAVLLTNTTVDSVEIVVSKLESKLKDHQLLSGNLIDITFQMGQVAYEPGSEIADFELLMEKIESERVSYVL
ncbi:GGDEF domain-containing protein [Sporosarcina aquimarina]|uniref:GGDEF domain-containing protein n=1 Tax=Sporosarcina aquimarina TaxID=114975 RepID=A0ABU4FYL3_9BACL|nr:GGDEF domain-containing protein [Sporosarcina aquimarina]MDW0109812.1 GGDEF domain-containing protein [Sporosarcina aquimarina]